MPNTTLTYDIQRINLFDSFEASRRGKDDYNLQAFHVEESIKEIVFDSSVSPIIFSLHCVSLLQPATSWLWVLGPYLAPLTAHLSVRSSLFVTPWKSLTSRHAGNIPQWTTKTASTLTSTLNTPP